MYFDATNKSQSGKYISRQKHRITTSMSLANNNMVTIYLLNYYNTFFDMVFLHINAPRIAIQME
jgi:hypothetical protein